MNEHYTEVPGQTAAPQFSPDPEIEDEPPPFGFFILIGTALGYACEIVRAMRHSREHGARVTKHCVERVLREMKDQADG